MMLKFAHILLLKARHDIYQFSYIFYNQNIQTLTKIQRISNLQINLTVKKNFIHKTNVYETYFKNVLSSTNSKSI